MSNENTCTWTESTEFDESGHFEADCGIEFWFMEMDRLTWNFCPNCGKKLIAVHASDVQDETPAK